MGVLKIYGTIRLDQFWPRGKSEADASKIKITVGTGSFQYSTNGTDFMNITVFDDAHVGQGRKKQRIIKRGNQVMVKLQGVDAPELNYRQIGPTPYKHPTRRGNLFEYDYEQLIRINNSIGFRQPMAEAAVVKLTELLTKNAKGGEVVCVFESHTDNPLEVCDTYGRFVGNIWIENKGKPVDLGLWLLEKGLAFPALYDCMTGEEISKVLAAAEKGKQVPGSVHSLYRDYLGVFDYELRYRDPLVARPEYHPGNDKGHLIHPKLYRRWCIYHIYKLAKVDIGSFADYLKACGDYFYFTAEYLTAKNAEKHALVEIIKGNRLIRPAGEIIFVEKHAQLKEGA